MTTFDLQICYSGVAAANIIKDKLRRFDGFEFDADSDEYKTKLESVGKKGMAKLKGVCEGLTLDIEGKSLFIALNFSLVTQ